MITALKLFVFLTVLTGALYPLAVTGLAQVFFKSEANGSLIERKGQVVGSVLIQQDFQSPAYFHGRPQEVTNLSPRSEKLKKLLEERAALGLKDEMLYASGSGLDPEIRPSSAYAQVDRIASARHFQAEEINKIVNELTIHPEFGFLGEARVNVLKMNLELDRLSAEVAHQ